MVVQRAIRIFLIATFALPSHLLHGEELSISEAIREALAGNRQLQARMLDVPLAQADTLSATLHPNPIFSIAADHLDLLGTGYDEENAAGPPEYSGRFDILVERGSKPLRRRDLARAQVESARAQIARRARELSLSVAESGLDTMEAGIATRLSGRTLELLQPVLPGPGESHAADLEVARVGAIAGRMRATHLEWTARSHRARRELQSMMGRSVSQEPPQVVGFPRRIAVIPALPILIEDSKRARPELLEYRAELERSRANERLQDAKAEVDPTVGSEYRRQQGLAGTGDSLGFFLSVPMPVSDRNQGERHRARTETRQIEATLAATESEVEGEVAALHAELAGSLGLVMQMEQETLRNLPTLEAALLDPDVGGLDCADALTTAHDLAQSYLEARIQLCRLLHRMECAVGHNLDAELPGPDPLELLLAPPPSSAPDLSGDDGSSVRSRIRGARRPGRWSRKRPPSDSTGPARKSRTRPDGLAPPSSGVRRGRVIVRP